MRQFANFVFYRRAVKFPRNAAPGHFLVDRRRRVGSNCRPRVPRFVLLVPLRTPPPTPHTKRISRLTPLFARRSGRNNRAGIPWNPPALNSPITRPPYPTSPDAAPPRPRSSHRVERQILADMTPAQRQASGTTAKKWAAICGRRSGKTVLGRMLCLLAPMRKPDSFAGYIALSRKNAKLQVWPRLLRMVERYSVPCKPNHADLALTYANGSTLFLGGADSTADIQKYRGLDMSFVLLDSGSRHGRPGAARARRRHPEPTLLDHHGTLAAISTPGPTLAGYLYDRTANPETRDTHVQTHHWTVFDNPTIPHAAEWLANLRRRNGWDESHPTYRREWLGEWVARRRGPGLPL